jgi:hypothetical protein
MSRRFLLTRPDHDPAVTYLSFWSLPLITQAVKHEFTVDDLAESRVTVANFNRSLEFSPSLILINGHGLPELITGYKNQVIISTKLINQQLAGAIIYGRSCQTANLLGPALINAGVKTYIGYTNDLVIVTSESPNPLDDKIASLFLEPLNLIISQLLLGHKSITGFKKCQKALRKNIRFLLKSRLKQTRDLAAYLWHDLNCQVLLGNDQSKVTSR